MLSYLLSQQDSQLVCTHHFALHSSLHSIQRHETIEHYTGTAKFLKASLTHQGKDVKDLDTDTGTVM